MHRAIDDSTANIISNMAENKKEIKSAIERLETNFTEIITKSNTDLTSNIKNNSSEIQTLKIIVFVLVGLSVVSIILGFIY